MRRRTVVALSLLVACAAPAHAQGGQGLVVRATANPCLSVRVQPSSTADRLACIPPGTPVTGIATAPYWRRIRLADGQEGWAAAKYLEAAPGAPTSDTAQVITAIPEDAWLEIHFVDVGTGDGTWIHTYDDGIPGNGRFEGKNIVIDGGPRGLDATNPFYAYLKDKAYERATIDALILTHPHNDHYPGAYSILRHFDVCDYYDPDYHDAHGGVGGDYATFLTAARQGRCGSATTTVHLGKAQFGQPNWGSELTVEFLWAWPGDRTGLGSTANNASIVMKLTYGTQSFLFTGDIEGKERDDSAGTTKFVEARLVNDSATASKLKSTLLKVPHHGSETSSTTRFINAVDPSIVVVTSGRRPYGSVNLPDKATLQRYCDHNPAIRIYRTDQDDEAEHRTGTNDKDGDHVVVRTNGRQTVVQALSGGRPFTPTACSP